MLGKGFGKDCSHILALSVRKSSGMVWRGFKPSVSSVWMRCMLPSPFLVVKLYARVSVLCVCAGGMASLTGFDSEIMLASEN